MIPSIFSQPDLQGWQFCIAYFLQLGAMYIRLGEAIGHLQLLDFRYVTLLQNQRALNWIEVEKRGQILPFSPPVKISGRVPVDEMSQWTFQAQRRTQSLINFWHGDAA